jgi:hypothetical protein
MSFINNHPSHPPDVKNLLKLSHRMRSEENQHSCHALLRKTKGAPAPRCAIMRLKPKLYNLNHKP